MATLQELQDAFLAADQAGNTDDAQFFADEIRKMQSAAVPEVPLQPVPAAPAPPSGSEPLLFPGPAQDRNALNPQQQLHGEYIDAANDVLRQMSTGLTFGGRDYAAPYLGSDRTVAEEQAETGAAAERMGPVAATGAQIMGGAVLPVEAALQAAKIIPAARSVMAAPKTGQAMQNVLRTVEQRAASEPGVAKAQIVREEAMKFLSEYGPALSKAEQDAVHEIITRGGGPVRRTVESIAKKSPSLGFDLPSLAGIGGGTFLGGAEVGAKLAAARAGLGLLAKTGTGTAKLARNIMTRSDISDLKKITGPMVDDSVPMTPAPKGPLTPKPPKSGASQPAPKIRSNVVEPPATKPKIAAKPIPKKPKAESDPVIQEKPATQMMREYMEAGKKPKKPKTGPRRGRGSY